MKPRVTNTHIIKPQPFLLTFPQDNFKVVSKVKIIHLDSVVLSRYTAALI